MTEANRKFPSDTIRYVSAPRWLSANTFDMRTCPCCGSEVEARVHVDLNTNSVQLGKRAWLVEARVAELILIVADAWPKTVSYQELSQGLFGYADADNINRAEHIKVYASRARHVLEQEGFTILTVRSRGYRLHALTPDAVPLLQRYQLLRKAPRH